MFVIRCDGGLCSFTDRGVAAVLIERDGRIYGSDFRFTTGPTTSSKAEDLSIQIGIEKAALLSQVDKCVIISDSRTSIERLKPTVVNSDITLMWAERRLQSAVNSLVVAAKLLMYAKPSQQAKLWPLYSKKVFLKHKLSINNENGPEIE